MRKIFSLLAALMLVSACVPLPREHPLQERLSHSSHSSHSSPPSTVPVELPIEIEETSSSTATGSGALAERVAAHGILEIGKKDAPLLLTVFTNYSCDYCEEFMRDMLPRLETDFMASGKLRVQFVIVPLKKYPNSTLETSALVCAAALEKGKMMHDALREAKLHDRKSLLALGKKLELPAKQFSTCLDAKETKNLLAEQQAFINDRGVTLIPAFMIDEEKKVGLPSYADLRGWIRSK